MKLLKLLIGLLCLLAFSTSCSSKLDKDATNNTLRLNDKGQKTGTVIEISPIQLITMLKYDKNTFVVDVRKTDTKIRSCKMIKGYQHIEDSLIYDNPTLLPKHKSIVLISKTGNRSRVLARFLKTKGISVYNLEGGMDSYWAWREQVIREKLNLYKEEIDVIELFADDYGC